MSSCRATNAKKAAETSPAKKPRAKKVARDAEQVQQQEPAARVEADDTQRAPAEAPAALPTNDRETAWRALVAHTEKVGKMKNAGVWLRKAISEEEARANNAGNNGAVA